MSRKKMTLFMRGLLKKDRVKNDYFSEFVSRIVPARLDGRKVKKLMLSFPSKGCSHALSKFGPCTMCSYTANSSFGKEIDEQKLNNFVKRILEKYSKNKPQIIELLSCGSFLDENEMPSAVAKNILKGVSKQSYCKKIIIETRPEYVNSGKIKMIFDIIGERMLEVRMGLESADDFVRNYCINKNTSKNDYEKAVKVLKKFGNARIFVYCLIKPPFLNEKEAIVESINTVKYAFSIGADTVSLKPLAIHPNTLVSVLAKKNLFKPPWLWSVVEVIKDSKKYGEVVVGSFFESPAGSLPSNCKKCSQRVTKALFRHNISQDFDELKRLDCDCKKVWEREINSLRLNKPLGKKAFEDFFKTD